MTDEQVVSLRLPMNKYRLYEAEAKARGIRLGTYLKQRLIKEDEIALNLKNIQKSARQIQATMDEANEINKEMTNNRDVNEYRGMILETLLLLRYAIQPGHHRTVQAEVRRLGYEVWNPDSWKDMQEESKRW